MILRRLLVLFLSLFLLADNVASAAPADEIAPLLRRALEQRRVGAEPLYRAASLHQFYRERDFQPTWSDGQTLLPAIDTLIAALPEAGDEGLDPRRYHLLALSERRERFRTAPSPALTAELDLLCSDTFLLLATHYLHGSVRPSTVDPGWYIPVNEGKPEQMLATASKNGLIRETLASLLPPDPSYAALRRAYADYRRLVLSGGWPQLKLKTPLKFGVFGPEIELLRQRLVTSNDLPVAALQGLEFNTELAMAVQHFQTRHGLTADGVVGPATLAALNIPAAQRARQLAANLERWRWLPRTFGDRYLLVNIPDSRLTLVEAGHSVLTMRTIVGRPKRYTPVLRGSMTDLVLNPNWEVPYKLAVEDILPKVRNHVSYLQRNNFTVFTDGNRPVDPHAINWQRLNAINFPYRLRQNPGPGNALGRIKFPFANDYSIYLHDTPSRNLFEHDQRAFSSGCIRLEKPLELAQELLRGTPLANSSTLQAALADAANRSIPLPTPIMVYLIYQTAWVEADGTLQFRPDIYQRDRKLAAALVLDQP